MELLDVIKQDCELWNKLNNEGKLLQDYMYLNECSDSKENGLYQLILNGCELWYGTLPEINAIVKSMFNRMKIEEEM